MYNRSIPPTSPVRHHSRIQILIHLEALLQAGDTVALDDGNRNVGNLGQDAIIQNGYDMWMVSLDQIGISKKTAIGSAGVAYSSNKVNKFKLEWLTSWGLFRNVRVHNNSQIVYSSDERDHNY